jgi:MATE family multidrug resistance protein
VAGLYGLEGTALAVTAGTAVIAGAVLVFDGMMGASLGALRGAGDVWAPLLIQAGVFWLVSVPLAALLGLRLGFGAQGLMLGILAGVALSLAALAARFRIVSRRPSRRI